MPRDEIVQPKLPPQRDPLEEAAALFDPRVAEQLREQLERRAEQDRERYKEIWKKVGGR